MRLWFIHGYKQNSMEKMLKRTPYYNLFSFAILAAIGTINVHYVQLVLTKIIARSLFSENMNDTNTHHPFHDRTPFVNTET